MSSTAALHSKTVAVWCASRDGTGTTFLEIARQAGTAIAREGGAVIYGGGGAGMMGAAANAALAADGRVHGVIPESMVERELAHAGLTRLEIVADMMVRKRRMLEDADAFLVLPGGIGTLDELFEALTWNQLGLHTAGACKPVVLLNGDGFYDGLLAWFETAVRGGVVAGEIAQPTVATSVEQAIEMLAGSPVRP